MKRENRVISFLLSLVPGLGQVYLGYSRGLVYIILESISFALFFSGANGSIIQKDDGVMVFLAIVIVITWIASIADSMVLRDRIFRLTGPTAISNSPESAAYGQTLQTAQKTPKDARKITAMLLSIIPGVGHMYLGMLVQGIQLLSISLLCFYLNSLLQDSIFMYFVPVIWFYSLFDVYKKVSTDDVCEDTDIIFISWIKKGSSGQSSKYKVVGLLLLLVGVATVINRIAADILSNFNDFYWLSKYIQIGFLAALFIAGGIKLLSVYHKMEELNGAGTSK